MILHVQPIPHVQPLSINRKWLVIQAISYHQRNQFLREMIRAIVVATAKNSHRKTVSTEVSEHQQIRPSLRRTIWRGCMNWCLLCEKKFRSIQWKISVHFIRAYLMIANISEFPACIHHDTGADYISLQENPKIFDTYVHMTFCRKVDDHIRLLFFKECKDSFSIANIQLAESEVGLVHD